MTDLCRNTYYNLKFDVTRSEHLIPYLVLISQRAEHLKKKFPVKSPIALVKLCNCYQKHCVCVCRTRTCVYALTLGLCAFPVYLSKLCLILRPPNWYASLLDEFHYLAYFIYLNKLFSNYGL